VAHFKRLERTLELLLVPKGSEEFFVCSMNSLCTILESL
jgi:hypothetical protein